MHIVSVNAPLQMSNNQNSFVKTESTCGVYEVILDTFSPPKLRSGFLAAAKSLENLRPGFNFVILAVISILNERNSAINV